MQLFSTHDPLPDSLPADDGPTVECSPCRGAWQDAVTGLRQLQTLLADHPRLQHFIISDDLKEVSVKLADRHAASGYRYFLLTCGHPNGPRAGSAAVWLRETGIADVRYARPPAAIGELVRRITAALA